uniref:Uncharacterized protein n=1 Tax=Strongyloides papillosus TaxID=174720 RepID=A0A0N5BUG0_STREA
MKVFRKLVLFIIILISRSFQRFSLVQNSECTITVSTKCYCKNKHDEHVIVRLFEKDTRLSSNANNQNINCGTNYTLSTRTMAEKNVKNLQVKVTHIGCDHHVSKMNLMDNKTCIQIGGSNGKLNFFCQEPYLNLKKRLSRKKRF